MPVTYDLSRFRNAIKRMSQVSKKTGAELLNQNILKVAVGSGTGKGLVHYTKKATKERIMQDMQTMITSVTKDGKVSTAPRVVMLATKWLKERGGLPKGSTASTWNELVKKTCAQIIKARVKSAQYIAVSWLFAARNLASKTPNKLTRLRGGAPKGAQWEGGTAAQSIGTPATPNSHVAILYNMSRGADIVITSDVYAAAIDDAIHDMNVYMARKMGEEYGKAVKSAL